MVVEVDLRTRVLEGIGRHGDEADHWGGASTAWMSLAYWMYPVTRGLVEHRYPNRYLWANLSADDEARLAALLRQEEEQYRAEVRALIVARITRAAERFEAENPGAR